MRNKFICDTLFEKTGEKNIFKCKLCLKTRKQETGKGYSNLINHLITDHPDYEDQCNVLSRNGSVLSHFVLIPKVVNIVDWMDWILDQNLPFSFVDKESTRKNSSLKPISSETLKAKMFLLEEHLQTYIAQNLPEKFGILFDGWSDSNVHYLAVYAVVPFSDIFGQYPLLMFSPLLDEENLSSESYNAAFDWIMDKYKKKHENISFFIGDNCSINVKAARDRGIPLIGCASHRLNLAVKKFLIKFSPILEKLNCLMKKLKTIKGKAFLKQNGFKMSKTINQTRWSSVFQMLERYTDFLKFENGKLILLLSENKDFLPLLLSPQENDEIKELFKNLKKLDSVCLFLQKPSATFAHVRLLFDKVIEEFPSLSSHLSTNASIVKYPNLENGLVKIQNQEEHLLTLMEKEALSFLKTSKTCNEPAPIDKPFDFAEGIVQQKKLRVCETSYVDTTYIVPTSNLVERLFSSSKDVLSDKRKSIKQESVELIMFLKVNRKMITSDMFRDAWQ
jgi:hypothetical protein